MHDIVSNHFFEIMFEGVKIGDSELMRISKAILDTGNTCISIPRSF